MYEARQNKEKISRRIERVGTYSNNFQLFKDNRIIQRMYNGVGSPYWTGSDYDNAINQVVGEEDIEDVSDEDYSGDYAENSNSDEYLSPANYYGNKNNKHKDLEGKVLAKYIQGLGPALKFLQFECEEENFILQGSRAADKQCLHRRKDGYVWHHGELVNGNTCRMQLVPQDWHRSWGHVGAAKQYGYEH